MWNNNIDTSVNLDIYDSLIEYTKSSRKQMTHVR